MSEQSKSNIDILLSLKQKAAAAKKVENNVSINLETLQDLIDYTIQLEKMRIMFEIQMAANKKEDK